MQKILFAMATVFLGANCVFGQELGEMPSLMGRCDVSFKGAEGLAETLQLHEATSLGFRAKFKYGGFRDWGHKLVKTKRKPPDLVREVAENLNRLGDTFALIYARDCVYLLTENGLVAAGTITPAEFPKLVRHSLDLDDRIAKRSPKRVGSKPGGRAEPTTSEGALREDRFDSSMLLPKEIQSRINLDRPKRLLILPSNDIGTVPFATLDIEGQLLIELTAPIILPDVVMLLDRSSWTSPLPKGDKLILGDPDLSKQSEWVFEPIPKSGEEADEIALREGAVALKGAGANRAAVMQFFSEKGKGANLLYFATHGMSDEDNPMDESFLALSDGHLFGSDIKKLQLKGHPLVVMSACQTALGKVFERGVFGLARAWSYAGASQVLMSLWDVDDDATKALILSFMDKHRSGMPAEFALREAMLSTKADYPDPGQWASFAVYGIAAPNGPGKPQK